VNFQDAAQRLAEAVHQFINATVDELAGKQPAVQAIETARGALHKVADTAADAELEQAAIFYRFVQITQELQEEQP